MDFAGTLVTFFFVAVFAAGGALFWVVLVIRPVLVLPRMTGLFSMAGAGAAFLGPVFLAAAFFGAAAAAFFGAPAFLGAAAAFFAVAAVVFFGAPTFLVAVVFCEECVSGVDCRRSWSMMEGNKRRRV